MRQNSYPKLLIDVVFMKELVLISNSKAETSVYHFHEIVYTHIPVFFSANENKTEFREISIATVGDS